MGMRHDPPHSPPHAPSTRTESTVVPCGVRALSLSIYDTPFEWRCCVPAEFHRAEFCEWRKMSFFVAAWPGKGHA